MAKLPRITSREMVAALRQLGFVEVGGRKHVKMRHPDGRITMVPRHPSTDLLPGTTAEILRQAEITEEELRSVL